MLNRVDKLLIGKDISRTASLILYKADGMPNLADGEIVVLDKNMKIMSAGATISDSDTIYIIQGTGDTYDYADADGTAVTSVRRFITSDPIEGAKVKNWKGVSYDAKGEKAVSTVLTAWTPDPGTEYILRIVYKDIKEHPGQFTQTYRHIATTTTLDTEAAALAAKVTAHSGARVTCTYTTGTDTLLVTGKAIPECTSSLTDIDKFSQVDFDMYLLYVNSSGNWQNISTTSQTITATDHGQGTWEQVRDLEKAAKGYRGFTNRTTFPVQEPTTYTVKDETYDLLVIESDKSYLSSDSWQRQTPLTTVVAIPNPASANQMTDVLAVLNPWFASCPGAFDAVSV
jgi:hypothetical protein